MYIYFFQKTFNFFFCQEFGFSVSSRRDVQSSRNNFLADRSLVRVGVMCAPMWASVILLTRIWLYRCYTCIYIVSIEYYIYRNEWTKVLFDLCIFFFSLSGFSSSVSYHQQLAFEFISQRAWGFRAVCYVSLSLSLFLSSSRYAIGFYSFSYFSLIYFSVVVPHNWKSQEPSCWPTISLWVCGV